MPLLDFTPILDASVQASVGVDSKFKENLSLVLTNNCSSAYTCGQPWNQSQSSFSERRHRERTGMY
jgi:hypothetical protein